jgi:hypothetical protein
LCSVCVVIALSFPTHPSGPSLSPRNPFTSCVGDFGPFASKDRFRSAPAGDCTRAGWTRDFVATYRPLPIFEPAAHCNPDFLPVGRLPLDFLPVLDFIGLIGKAMELATP